MTMKTSELTGAALDWAVSKADNPPGQEGGMDWWERDSEGYLFDPLNECRYSPSTNWAQGGPIINRERIELKPTYAGWTGFLGNKFFGNGTTPLEAAMRCYVASKLAMKSEYRRN